MYIGFSIDPPYSHPYTRMTSGIGGERVSSVKALLLGAGYGTRLYPLTRDRPKPLLPVGGKPILERILDCVFPIADIDGIYIVSNTKFTDRYREWQSRYLPKRKVPIQVIDDGTTSNDNRLGAIGDIQFVIDQARVKDDLLVIAGDNLIEFDLRDFVSFALARGPAVGLKDLKGSSLISRYSAVELDAERRIVGFEEKPPMPKTSLISIGVYLYPKKEVRRFRQYIDEGLTPDAPGYFVQWLVKQMDVYGYVVEGPWFDIGDIDSYNAANALYERK